MGVLLGVSRPRVCQGEVMEVLRTVGRSMKFLSFRRLPMSGGEQTKQRRCRNSSSSAAGGVHVVDGERVVEVGSSS